jgi:hypothetical protein
MILGAATPVFYNFYYIVCFCLVSFYYGEASVFKKGVFDKPSPNIN